MKYILIAAVIILGIFLFFLMKIPIGIEPLTELYFENHTKLPVNIFPDQKYNFTFTVHNLEYMEMNYSYKIYAEYGNITSQIDYGNLQLENNQSSTIYEEFRLDEEFTRAKINIELERLQENPKQKDPNLKNQTLDIHFWVDEIQPTRIIFTNKS
ncbi:MAG: hypothetical protein ABIH72_00495 [archaeon]